MFKLLCYVASLIVLYFIWRFIIKIYSGAYYYKRQGIPFLPYLVPIFGNGLTMAYAMKHLKKDENAFGDSAKVFFGDYDPKVYGVVILGLVSIRIRDPVMLEELYVSKNKFYDKHFFDKQLFYPSIHDSILFSKSDELWAKKRKILSAAFYKEKLAKMMDILMDETRKKFDIIDSEYIS
mmetsp:Transcript_9545/g.9149  ORF Transcript_9545/g.9149 Transcript_9545/m.9149 type:complete len:179 (+) Transcript_9545:28-564(+)